jgi:hypothetical protein
MVARFRMVNMSDGAQLWYHASRLADGLPSAETEESVAALHAVMVKVVPIREHVLMSVTEYTRMSRSLVRVKLNFVHFNTMQERSFNLDIDVQGFIFPSSD